MANKSYFLLFSAIVYALFYSQDIYAANKEQAWADCIAARDEWNAGSGSDQSSWCTESSSTAPTGGVLLQYYGAVSPPRSFPYDKLCAIPTERYNPETHVCKAMPDCGTFNLSGNSGSTGYQTSTACMPQGASACWYEGFPYDTSNSSLPVCSDTGGCTGSTCGTGSTGDTSNTGDTGDTSNTGDTGGTGTGVTGGTGTGTGSTGTDTGTGNTGCIGSGCVSGDGTGNTGNTGSTGDSGNSDNTGDTYGTGSTGNSGNSDNTGDTYGTGSTGNSGSTGDTSGTGCSGSTCDTTPGNPSGSTSGVGAFDPVPYRGGMGPGMGTYTGATAEPKTAGGGSGGSGLGTFEPWTTSVDEEIGKWYEPTEETLETVLEENASTISNNALFTFLPDTFNVTVPSSDGCPVWELPAVMGMQSVTVAPLCSDIMNSLWPMVRAIVIGSSVFMALGIVLRGFS